MEQRFHGQVTNAWNTIDIRILVQAGGSNGMFDNWNDLFSADRAAYGLEDYLLRASWMELGCSKEVLV